MAGVLQRQLLPGHDVVHRRADHAEVADAGRARAPRPACRCGRTAPAAATAQHLGARSCTSSTAAGTCTTPPGRAAPPAATTSAPTCWRAPAPTRWARTPTRTRSPAPTSTRAAGSSTPACCKCNNKLYLVGSGFIGGSTQSLVIAPMSNPYTLASGHLHHHLQPDAELGDVGRRGQRGARAALPQRPHLPRLLGQRLLGPRTTSSGQLDAAPAPTRCPPPPGRRSRRRSSSATTPTACTAPGHNGFFTSPDGTENWIVYHANDAGERRLRQRPHDPGAEVHLERRRHAELRHPGRARHDAAPAPPARRRRRRPRTRSSTATAASAWTSTAATPPTAPTSSSGPATAAPTSGGAIEDLGDDTSRLVNVATGKVARRRRLRHRRRRRHPAVVLAEQQLPEVPAGLHGRRRLRADRQRDHRQGRRRRRTAAPPTAPTYASGPG